MEKLVASLNIRLGAVHRDLLTYKVRLAQTLSSRQLCTAPHASQPVQCPGDVAPAGRCHSRRARAVVCSLPLHLWHRDCAGRARPRWQHRSTAQPPGTQHAS